MAIVFSEHFSKNGHDAPGVVVRDIQTIPTISGGWKGNRTLIM